MQLSNCLMFTNRYNVIAEKKMKMNRRIALKTVTAVAGVIASISLIKNLSPIRIKGKLDSAKFDQLKPLIASIAETIIPRTDSPGANDARVADCVVKLICDCESEVVKRSFVSWLTRVEQDSEKKYGRRFASCDELQRAAILVRYEHNYERNSLFRKIRLRVLGMDGMETMKKYTIISFCTSMEGATQALVYDYVPGSYQACITMESGQKSWATN